MIDLATAKKIAATQDAPVQFETKVNASESLFGYCFQQFTRAGFASKGACTREMNAHVRRGLSSHLKNN